MNEEIDTARKQSFNAQQPIDVAFQHHAAGRLTEAEGIYQQVLQSDPKHPEALHMLGVLAHQTGENDRALDLIGKALTVKPQYESAYVNQGIVLQDLNRLDEAVLSYGNALSINPENADVHFNLGTIHQDSNKLDKAVTSYSRALAIEPDFMEAHFNLGDTLQKQGNLEQATACYHSTVALQPDHADAHYNLGIALLGLNKLEEAAASFRKTVAVRAENEKAYYNLGIVLQELGRLDEAADSYRKALTLQPNYAEAHYNLGIILHESDQLEEAVACFRKAIAIKPDYAEAYNNLGTSLQKLDQLDDAEDSYRIALSIKPDFAEARGNLGSTLKERNKLDEAADSYRKALAINPDDANSHFGLGATLQALNQLDDAVASYDNALAIKPDYAEAFYGMGSAFKDLGRLDDAATNYRRALAVRPGYTGAQSNLLFSLNYSGDCLPDEMVAEARQFGAMVTSESITSKHPNNPDPHRRLRVGLVSGDFRTHPVSYFLDALLKELDTGKLELFAYATTSREEDDMTARLKRNVPNWRRVAKMDDTTLSTQIRKDEIDILVDLSGHSAGKRLTMFARKPAPVLVTWLGYVATTGVEAIDYILCDQHVLPPEDEWHFVEKPWRLPDTYLCFTPPDMEIDVSALPALANSYVTFGCFNNLTKVTDSVIHCWASILRDVPESRLFLKASQLGDASVQHKIQSQFSSLGIPPERLLLQGFTDRTDYLEAYRLVDITLDPFPFGGVTTSNEALWMGTPILTMQGDMFISRAGGSILHNVGLEHWIADTPRDYVKKAVAYSADLQALSTLRKGLRERFLSSPVCDASQFARNLEDAFQGMWRKWCTQTKG
jgi:protein O-GlcNAc transferase